MGVSVEATAFVGIRVTDWRPLRQEHTSRQEVCARGHKRREGQGPFCDQDGSAFDAVKVIRPTPKFSAWLLKRPEWVSGDLTTWVRVQDRLRWGGPGPDRENMPHLFPISPVNQDPEREEPLGFGTKLIRVGAYDNQVPNSFNPTTLELAFNRVEEWAKELGLEGDVELFISLGFH